MTESLIDVTVPGDDGVAVLTIRRAEKKNALSIAVRDQMSDALDRLAADDACRALVITGAGDVFCAGFDLDEFNQPDLADQLWSSSDRWHRTIIEFPLPSVAAVNGSAFGGGFDLAVMCDLRVAADHAVFAHPERVFTEIVYGPLHELVGGAVARDVALTGRRIGADEALSLGLVSRVVPAGQALEAAVALAAEIAATPRDVLGRMKAKILRRAGIEPGATLDL
jgi:enoyl-CoA hydratase/carnithine racemase